MNLKNMGKLKPTNDIENQLYKAKSWTMDGDTAVSGMTYEEGVEAALEWVLGEEENEPIEAEKEESED